MLAILLAYPPAFAQTTPSSQGETVLSEQGKLIRAPQALGVLGTDLFGDKVNFYNGSLEFVQTDVSLPGNNSLPVAVGRRLVVGDANQANHEFMQWTLDIPRIHGVFSDLYGWTGLDANGNASPQRCTHFGKPRDINFGSANYFSVDFYARDYWHGNMLYVPGVGDQEILKRNPLNTNIPTDGQPTPLVTKGHWAIRCLPALANTNALTPVNQTGEGFLAIGPDGTQYRFDWLVTRRVQPITKFKPRIPDPLSNNPDQSSSSVSVAPLPPENSTVGAPLATNNVVIVPDEENAIGGASTSVTRSEVEILPTLITDRFGNTVRYNYDPFQHHRLLSIVASDGRTLTFNYSLANDFIQSVTDGTRTWTYTYAPAPSGRTVLSTVTLPDQTRWQLAGMEGPLENEYRSGLYGLRLTFATDPDGIISYSCLDTPPNVGGPTGIGSMVHPSGAVGTFHHATDPAWAQPGTRRLLRRWYAKRYAGFSGLHRQLFPHRKNHQRAWPVALDLAQ